MTIVNKMENKIIAKQDVSWKINDTYYHLITCAVQSNGEIFIHFVSKYRDKVLREDNVQRFPEMTKLPDHISYHKDGTTHIKYKGGQKSKLFKSKFKKTLLETPHLMDLPFLVISYHKKGFELNKYQCPSSNKKPIGHNLISIQNSFTLVFYLRDLTNVPLEKRTIEIIGIPGCIPTDKVKLPKAANDQEMDQIVSMSLNPNMNLINQISLNNCNKTIK